MSDPPLHLCLKSPGKLHATWSHPPMVQSHSGGPAPPGTLPHTQGWPGQRASGQPECTDAGNQRAQATSLRNLSREGIFILCHHHNCLHPQRLDIHIAGWLADPVLLTELDPNPPKLETCWVQAVPSCREGCGGQLALLAPRAPAKTPMRLPMLGLASTYGHMESQTELEAWHQPLKSAYFQHLTAKNVILIKSRGPAQQEGCRRAGLNHTAQEGTSLHPRSECVPAAQHRLIVQPPLLCRNQSPATPLHTHKLHRRTIGYSLLSMLYFQHEKYSLVLVTLFVSHGGN